MRETLVLARICALGLVLSACASGPPASGPMRDGPVVEPPPGWVGYCQGNPGDVSCAS